MQDNSLPQALYCIKISMAVEKYFQKISACEGYPRDNLPRA